MQLGLAHSVSRYKLSFTSEKVDTMIIQAVSLLEDLDKELNNYAMRLREWYSWHFPELSKIITDNTTYAQAVILIGMRTNVKSISLEKMQEVVPEELSE
jgi:nucleolar protein 58